MSKLSFKEYLEQRKAIKPAGGKALNAALVAKKGGGHYSEKSDYKRAKEKQKFLKSMDESSPLNVSGSILNVKTPSVSAIATKHGVSKKVVELQLKKGIEVELEHTKHRGVAREIALDHLNEDPQYYKKLAKMEGQDK